MGKRKGFTLIECLVVTGATVFLMASLTVGALAAGEQSKRAACLSNQRSISLGFLHWATDNAENYTERKIYSLWNHNGEWQDWLPTLMNYIEDDIQVFNCPSGGFVTLTEAMNVPKGPDIHQCEVAFGADPYPERSDFTSYCDYNMTPGAKISDTHFWRYVVPAYIDVADSRSPNPGLHEYSAEFDEYDPKFTRPVPLNTDMEFASQVALVTDRNVQCVDEDGVHQTGIGDNWWGNTYWEANPAYPGMNEWYDKDPLDLTECIEPLSAGDMVGERRVVTGCNGQFPNHTDGRNADGFFGLNATFYDGHSEWRNEETVLPMVMLVDSVYGGHPIEANGGVKDIRAISWW